VRGFTCEVYGAEVPGQTITVITDRVMEGLAEWQSRPLDSVYAVIFIDAINVKIREGQVANRPIYLALGVTVDGERDVLGLWAGEHGDGDPDCVVDRRRRDVQCAWSLCRRMLPRPPDQRPAHPVHHPTSRPRCFVIESMP
jgi:transposase-like protein